RADRRLRSAVRLLLRPLPGHAAGVRRGGLVTRGAPHAMTRDTEALWLRPNVVAEPLVNRWYAWSHLISPMTAPLYVSNLLLPILESYLAVPHVHGAAAGDPSMAGGPFVDCD